MQEALIAAGTQWPRDGVPDSPRGWLITVASRRLIDLLRAEQARRRREDTAAVRSLAERSSTPADQPTALDGESAAAFDDTLIVLFLCCHPALSPASQIALTLRAVGGLTTSEIARAFLVPEWTMTRRISRAKQRIKDSGIGFSMPPTVERGQRLEAMLHVLYLIFNEGYASTSGPSLQRRELSAEAIRLMRIVHRSLPNDSEVSGLLALMVLTDARRSARTGPDGSLVPMAEQDRSRWDADNIAEGVALLSETLPRGATGQYQLQAAIAAIHDEAPTADDTDWAQIVQLYELLLQIADNPVVMLNHAVAVGMANGPEAGLELLDGIAADQRIARDHRLPAVRAHLLEMAGDRVAARHEYLAAAGSAIGIQQQRYLHSRAERLSKPARDHTDAELRESPE